MSSTYDLDRAGLDAALDVLLDLGVAEAVGYADRLAALVVLHRRAGAMTLNPTGIPGAPRSADPARAGDTWILAAEDAGVQWAAAARLGSGSCVIQLTDAVRLTGRFAQSVAALRETVTLGGDAVPRMTPRKQQLLDDETGVLDHATAQTVEARALPIAATKTPNEFRTLLRRLVTELAPQVVTDARAAAVEARYVLVSAEPAGTGSLFVAGIPAPLARACDLALSDLARRGPRDGRTRDQRRVDALLACVLGPASLLDRPEPLGLFDVPDDSSAADGAWDLADLPPVFCGVPSGSPQQRADAAGVLRLVRDLLAQVDYTLPAPPQVEVHVIRDQRHQDGVAELDGYGPIDPHLAAELSDGARTRVVWTGGDPATADPGYRPSARTRRAVKARDRHCRFPGCTRPPSSTDIDHATAYQDQPQTSVEDCELLCRLHHRIKHQTPWSLDLRSNGECHWASPTGRVYITHPPGNAP